MQLVFHIYIFYTVVQIPRLLSSFFINKYTTNVTLSIIYGLENVDQQVEYSLIRTFPLFKLILLSLGRLFQRKKNSQYIELSNYFLSPVTGQVIESPLEIYFGVLVFSPTGKIMFTSLNDYFSKQKLSVFNNDCWNFHKPKQQCQLIV